MSIKRCLLCISIFVVALMLFTGCSDMNDDSPDADNPDGDTPDGDVPDGDVSDGDVPDGDAPDGDTPIDGDVDSVPDGDGEIDGDEDVPLPDEIGCEVDPDALDAAELISFDAEAVPHDGDTFSVLVQAGAMTTAAVTLWTYTEDNESKRLRVWREIEDSDQIALVFDDDVVPSEGFIKHRVSGLAPRTEYHYGFFTMDGDAFSARSLIGRFKTAFPDGCLAPLVIGGTHGTNKGKQPYKALEITATYDLDMFIHLGDYSYNDNAAMQSGVIRDVVEIDSYRAIWKETLDDVGFRALLPSAGQYIVRDDHEICDNSCLEDDDFRDDIHFTGMDSFLENTPVESDGYKLWRSYRWGDTAEIFVLDCRSERQPATRKTDDAIYIGRDQMDWLKQSLAESTAHFKIILNSVPITLFDHSIWLMDFDRWQGYASQREEILQHIVDEDIANVWWLTGDFHLGSVNRVQSSGEYSAMWEIMMGPGGNDGNPIWELISGELDLFPVEEIVPPNQFDFIYGFKATTIVTFDPIRDHVHVLFFDAETGEMLYDKKLNWAPFTGEDVSSL